MTGSIVSGRTTIPVRNLWLLMLYASKLFATNGRIRSGAEQHPDDLPDLVTEILVTAVDRRLQRHLSQTYVDRRESLTRVRGRIDVLRTESAQLLSRGRVACRFTELDVDNPRNQLLLAALRVGGGLAQSPELAHRCRQLAGMMGQIGVSAVVLSPDAADRIMLGRNDSDDTDAVNAARLLLRMNLPNEDTGFRHRMAPLRDVEEIRRLYEAAVRGLYRVALPQPWRVHAGETRHTWPVTESSGGAAAILPVMRTDVILESPDRRIIVETKFADALKPNHYGVPKLSRDHMFQLYAYVQSQSGRDALAPTTEGVLLYPVVGGELDEYVVIGGHRYRFLTVDLAGPAATIRRRLLSVTADGSAV
ncbi:5-methylcytosine restriction system specificity protein McrC [Mycolicibacterium mageritense]|uniref:5-methylcytosine restriction system specificity protein McrC n=1 Tax=Mycolicibacterium mageritense TaxID=53462 RepID=UPI0023F58467|nr:5-methylcytosine-specific restriction system specificity protein McrC [Mycolicibacterium mageritense]